MGPSLRPSVALAAAHPNRLGTDRAIGLEARDDFDRNGVAEESFDVAQELTLVDAHE